MTALPCMQGHETRRWRGAGVLWRGSDIKELFGDSPAHRLTVASLVSEISILGSCASKAEGTWLHDGLDEVLVGQRRNGRQGFCVVT